MAAVVVTAAAAAGDARAEGRNYEVSVRAPASGKVGEAAAATVRVLARNGYHVNREYPTSLRITVPQGAAAPKSRFTAADAKVRADSEFAFEVPFSLRAAGGQEFVGDLRFSVCTETQCDLAREKVTWRVEAK